MTVRTRTRSARPGVTGEASCWWCHISCAGSPFRSPLPDIGGARYVVCSPQCPDRPEGVTVIYDEVAQ